MSIYPVIRWLFLLVLRFILTKLYQIRIMYRLDWCSADWRSLSVSFKSGSHASPIIIIKVKVGASLFFIYPYWLYLWDRNHTKVVIKVSGYSAPDDISGALPFTSCYDQRGTRSVGDYSCIHVDSFMATNNTSKGWK